jgi:ABC-type Fe3+-hydroxamate transport system substrate-binding protein/adenosylcobinamide amidohydrolase
MKTQIYKNRSFRFYLIAVIVWGFCCATGWTAPIKLTDDTGHHIHLDSSPQRVVSLVPSATEIIFAVGAKDALAGITYHSTALPGASEKTIVGGFFRPSADRILSLTPDLIIASPLHTDLIAQVDTNIPMMIITTRKMNDAFRHIRLMGKLFQRESEAQQLVEKNRYQLDMIARKVAQIPADKRVRVMRLMGRETIMTPGSDSFQNEMIRAAGGIPPDFGKTGSIVPVTLKEWKDFNPQVIYGCGGDHQTAKTFFSQKEWQTVDAVKNHRFHNFPCDLTCRAGVHLGTFVSWLASVLYTDEFADQNQEIFPRKIIHTYLVPIELDYVRQATIATSILHDFKNKSLIIEFNSPRPVVSTLEGQRQGICTVGNHYSPAPCWRLNHCAGLDHLRNTLFPVLHKKPDDTSFLFTGADMDHLAVKKETYKAMTVYALVTAGVSSNAVRMSTDTGRYYEPGTINIILMTNMKLTPRAMTRAIISATEAKTASLQDLDIRSSYLPLTAAATGTGTDNIIVVQGDGPVIDTTGGHSKMGELIARAAYAGVREAISRQNGIVASRDIFQRLGERRLSISQLADSIQCDDPGEKSRYAVRIETLLMNPTYSGFLEAAMALNDAAEKGVINDLMLYESWCLDVATRIAGKKVDRLKPLTKTIDIPSGPLAMALHALLTGILIETCL